MPPPESGQGTLYVVATPIGNLEDITLRALRVLKEVDLIAAEDTRHTRKLLSHYHIKTGLISYHAHNQASRGPELIERLLAGENLALVSDAGTPGFSDPGADLAARAWEAGLTVAAVPGPAAGVAALSMAGFPGDALFIGFLPRTTGKRQKFLAELAKEKRVIILYESPQRLPRTLAEIAAAMPQRQALVVRELSKKFEQAWRGPAAEVARQLEPLEIKGECTLVLSCPGPSPEDASELNLEEYLIRASQAGGLTGRRLAQQAAMELGLPRRQAYQAYLALKAKGQLQE